MAESILTKIQEIRSYIITLKSGLEWHQYEEKSIKSVGRMKVILNDEVLPFVLSNPLNNSSREWFTYQYLSALRLLDKLEKYFEEETSTQLVETNEVIAELYIDRIERRIVDLEDFVAALLN